MATPTSNSENVVNPDGPKPQTATEHQAEKYETLRTEALEVVNALHEVARGRDHVVAARARTFLQKYAK